MTGRRASPGPESLERFVAAQAGEFEIALAELGAGRKRGHWMWFVFPQLRGLGRSDLAWIYGVASLAEARAYLDHPVLGPRLGRAVVAATLAPAQSLRALFGCPDDLKYRSCLTLFDRAAAPGDDIFSRSLARWGLTSDPVTLDRLGTDQGSRG